MAFAPDELFKTATGEYIHEVGGQMVQDTYRDGVLVTRIPVDHPSRGVVDEDFADRLATELESVHGWDIDPDGNGSGMVELRAALQAAALPAVPEVSYRRDEVAEAMEILRGPRGSTALVGEVLAEMERVLLAAAPAQEARGG